MREKLLECILISLFVSVFIWVFFFIEHKLSKRPINIIKDPVIVYDDLRIEEMDNRGVWGVISRKDLKDLLGYKNTWELMEEKKRR